MVLVSRSSRFRSRFRVSCLFCAGAISVVIRATKSPCTGFTHPTPPTTYNGYSFSSASCRTQIITTFTFVSIFLRLLSTQIYSNATIESVRSINYNATISMFIIECFGQNLYREHTQPTPSDTVRRDTVFSELMFITTADNIMERFLPEHGRRRKRGLGSCT